MLSALFGSSVWLFLATALSLPVSTTHAIVGGIVGFALVARGGSSVNWTSLGNIALSWVASPLSGFVGGYLIYVLIIKTIIKTKDPKEAAFKQAPLHVSATVAIMVVFTIDSGLKALKLSIELWMSICIGAGVGILAGIATWYFIIPIYRNRDIEDQRKKKEAIEMAERESHISDNQSESDLDTRSEVSDVSYIGSEADLQLHWWHGSRYYNPSVGDQNDVDLNDVEIDEIKGEGEEEVAVVYDDIDVDDTMSRSSSIASDTRSVADLVPVPEPTKKPKAETPIKLETHRKSEEEKPKDEVEKKKRWWEKTREQKDALRAERKARKTIAKKEYDDEVELLGRHATVPLFFILQIGVSGFVALGHGANNVPNSTGPFGAVMAYYQTGGVGTNFQMPIWIFVIASIALDLGLIFFGKRVLLTIGEKVTTLTPTGGYVAQLSTSLTTIVCSRLGMPISTTHVLVGAVMGVGVAKRGRKALNWAVIWRIAVSWLVTLPVAAVTTIALYYILWACGI